MPDRHYLKLLARDYPTSQAAAAEIVRLNALMSLPKGTEYFFSDLHGEHEAFIHLLRSASGFIRRKVDDLFDKIKEELISLISQNPDNGGQAMDLIMIAKYFERIGDHATNIAEWVIFSMTGKVKIQ